MQPSSYSSPAPVNGVLILILGILSICGVPILGPVAWIMGNKGLALIDRGNGDFQQRRKTMIGRICGMVGTVILVLAIVAYVAIAMIGAGIVHPNIDQRHGRKANKAMLSAWSKKAHSREGILMRESRKLEDAIASNDAAHVQSIVRHDRAVLNVRNSRGETPLFQTVNAGNLAMTSLLLRFGANVNAKDNSGATPLDKANALGKGEVLAVLVSHGGRSGKS